MTTYAMNFDTGATSRYEGYDFNSFFQGVDGKLYALADDGLYRLEGDTVEACLFLGRFDFGTEALKHTPAAYAGCSSESPLVLRVGTPEGKWQYEARTSGTSLKQQRFDLGRGLRSNWFSYELYNTDGGDFSVADFSVTPAASGRRI